MSNGEQEIKEVEGFCQAVSDRYEDPKKPRFGIMVNGEWYNKFGKRPSTVVKGAYLKVRYTDRMYQGIPRHNIRGIEVVSPEQVPTEQPVPVPSKPSGRVSTPKSEVDKRASLKDAVIHVGTLPESQRTAEKVVEVAKKFNEYLKEG